MACRRRRRLLARHGYRQAASFLREQVARRGLVNTEAKARGDVPPLLHRLTRLASSVEVRRRPQVSAAVVTEFLTYRAGGAEGNLRGRPPAGEQAVTALILLAGGPVGRPLRGRADHLARRHARR